MRTKPSGSGRAGVSNGRGEHQDVVVRPEDPLDLDEARRLVAEIEALPPGVRVHVDVSALREVHPTGLAFLGYALGRDQRVRLGGLNRRHERLLAYLLAEPAMRAASSSAAAADRQERSGREGREEGAPATAGTAASRFPS